jgi:hypothetical protein
MIETTSSLTLIYERGQEYVEPSISIDLSAIIRLPNPIVKRMNQSSIQTNPKGNPAKRLQYTVPSTKQLKH